MRTLLTIVAASIAAGFMIAASPAQAEGEPAVSLHHRFTVPERVAFGPISVELAPGGWRVGHADGPLATEAQLRAVLSRLTRVEVGARCAGWVEAATSYPCGFAIADLDFGGMVPDPFSGITADWESVVPQPRISPAADRPARPDPSGHGLISPVLDAERFVALRAPLRYLGDKSGAFGARIAFRFRAVTNALVPSEFNRASGAIVLHADPGVALPHKPADASST